jgi:hypothetical protein
MARAGNTFLKFVPLLSAVLPRKVVLVVACVLAAVLSGGAARAHEIGLSRGQYVWRSGKVLAAITFAQSDLAASLP